MALVAQSFHWVVNPNGALSGRYPAGDMPPEEATLAWAIGTALSDAGIDEIDNGTPWSHNVRQYLSGTEAGTATISLQVVSGNTTGWTAPGSGNNLAYDAVSDASGQFQLKATGSDGYVLSDTVAWECASAPIAANFVIAAGTGSVTFNGTTQGVQPGHVIELAAGTHGKRTIQNIAGTAENPVIIRGPLTGQAIIRRSSPASGSFLLILKNCHHFVLDGSSSSDAPLENDGRRHSIKIMHASTGTTDAPTAFVKFAATNASAPYSNSHDARIKQIAIDGGWPTYATDGIGISTNDGSVLAATFPGQFQENIIIEYCYIRRCQGEGCYLGPNPSAGEVPLKGIEVHHNYMEDCGWNALNPKSWYEGTNSVHHNISLRCGSESHATQAAGMAFVSCKVDIYNNWIEESGEQGIKAWNGDAPLASVYPTFEMNIYNNVIIRSGQLFTEDGIDISSDSGYTKPLVRCYNNTVVDSSGVGIKFGSNISSSSWARNNIVLNSGGAEISVGPGSESDNTTTGNPATVFTNYAGDDFTLAAAIAASGTVGVDIASTDYDGTARPQGATSDRGAYEKA